MYTSNLWAILWLRGLHGFVSTFIQRMRYLDKVGEQQALWVHRRPCRAGQGREGQALGTLGLPTSPGALLLLCGGLQMHLLRHELRVRPSLSNRSPPPILNRSGCGARLCGRQDPGFVGYSVATEVSLGVVADALALGVVASVLSPAQPDQEKDG